MPHMLRHKQLLNAARKAAFASYEDCGNMHGTSRISGAAAAEEVDPNIMPSNFHR